MLQNQGTIIKDGKAPEKPRDLLAAPRGLFPKTGTTIQTEFIEFGWNSIEGARTYVVEVSLTPSFENLLEVIDGIKENQLTYKPPQDGIYYWRVVGVDAKGFPGEKSKGSRLMRQQDSQPPQLVVTQPETGFIANTSTILVEGTSEFGTTLTLNNVEIPIQENGAFKAKAKLKEGENQLTFLVKDSVGNFSQVQKQVTYVPDETANVVFDANLVQLEEHHFLTRADDWGLSGTTLPSILVEVLSSDNSVVVSGKTNTDGTFSLRIPVKSPSNQYILQTTAISGFQSQIPFQLTQDREPPTLKLNKLPPSTTRKRRLKLKGTVEGNTTLKFNGKTIEFADNAFVVEVKLDKGVNNLVLEASDAVGNEALWNGKVVLDREAPEFQKFSSTPKQAKGKGNLDISVSVQDATSMKPTAKALLHIGKQKKRIQLRLNKRKGTYETKLKLKANETGRVQLLEITLEDYLGNRKTYKP